MTSNTYIFTCKVVSGYVLKIKDRLQFVIYYVYFDFETLHFN